MNQDQILGIVRNAVALLGGIGIGRGWLTAEQVTLLGSIAAAIVPFVWTLFVHTDSAKIAAVTAMPDVGQIRPAPNAAPDSAVSLAALDPNQPKVAR